MNSFRTNRGRVPRRAQPIAAGAAVLVAIGCVTINVYFPTRQIERAADAIVDEVRPDLAASDSPSIDGENGEGESEPKAARWSPAESPPLFPATAWISAGVPAALAGVVASSPPENDDDKEGDKEKGDRDELKPPPSEFDLDIATPKIKKIKAELKKRYQKLLPLYREGRVGEGHTGLLVKRDLKDLTLKKRRAVLALIGAENRNRQDLYSELARANKIDPKRVVDIGKIFAKAWQKKCKTGWWIEVKKGKWEKKKPPKKKPRGRSADAATDDDSAGN